MFLLPFIKYLKPYKYRMAIAIFCLFGMGLFGSSSLILFKPALDVMFDVVKLDERRTATSEKIAKHEERLVELSTSQVWQKKIEYRWKQLYFPVYRYTQNRVLDLYAYADRNKVHCMRLLAFIYVGMAIMRGIFEYGGKYNMSYSLYSGVINLKSDLFRHVLGQDMAFFSDRPVGFLMSRIGSDVAAIRQILEMMIRNALQPVIELVIVITALLFLNAKLSLLVFIGIVPAVLILLFFAKWLKGVTRKQKSRSDTLSAVMGESLYNVRLVKAFSTEGLECERFDVHNRKLFQYEINRRVARFGASPIMEVLGAVGLAVVLILSFHIINAGMEATMFMTYLLFLSRLYQPLKLMSKLNVNWQTSVVSVERIQEILALRPSVVDPAPSKTPVRIEHVSQGFVLENVCFGYRNKEVLSNIDLKIPQGSTTAIVGRSGAGKTTLANLLLRLYDPISGRILLDGHDLRDFRVADLHKHYGIVTQETLLFDDMVANNIAYGSDTVDLTRVAEAARMANAHDFIMSLDGGKGYGTYVGSRGSKLSGGQRQRIAIARAFYRSPDILILDEATSSLDNQSEAAIQEALPKLMTGRTVIIIAHRLTTIQHADNIVVLDDGKLTEQGTYAELMKQGGFFATLYRLGEFGGAADQNAEGMGSEKISREDFEDALDSQVARVQHDAKGDTKNRGVSENPAV
jgi:ABC-type multidrug transport system fused ATPase/permease subunit